MKIDLASLIFDLFLLVAAIVFFVSSLSFDFRPWLFPGLFSLVLIIMVAGQILSSLKKGKKLQILSTLVSDDRVTQNSYGRIGFTVFSIITFYLLFRYTTIYLAVPFLTIMFLRFLGHRPWRVVFLTALCLDGFIYVFFQLFLQTSL